MATANILPSAAYALDGDRWSGNVTTQTSSTVDADLNRYYLGAGDFSWGTNARCRLIITIPSNITIATVDKLVVSLTADSNWTPKYMRAYLSKKNTSTSDTKHIVGSSSTAADRLEMSYLYSDINGTTQQTAYMAASSSKTKTCYLVFKTYKAFKPGETYYIYILPYDSNSKGINEWNFSNTWARWRNTPGYTNVTLYYESGVVQIYTGVSTNGGWQKAIPYIYTGVSTNGGWQQAIPYINKDGTANGWAVSTG